MKCDSGFVQPDGHRPDGRDGGRRAGRRSRRAGAPPRDRKVRSGARVRAPAGRGTVLAVGTGLTGRYADFGIADAAATGTCACAPGTPMRFICERASYAAYL